jgi:hypothetical protein
MRKRRTHGNSTKGVPKDLLEVESRRAYWQNRLNDLKRYELQLKRMHPADAGLALMDRVYEQHERSEKHA